MTAPVAEEAVFSSAVDKIAQQAAHAAEEAAPAAEEIALALTAPLAEDAAPVYVAPATKETEATPTAKEAEVAPAAKEVAPGWKTLRFPSPCW